MCDSRYADIGGCKLSDDYDALCLPGFADDQAVTLHSETSAICTIIFHRIDLEVNPDKSQAVIIRNGILANDALHLSNGSEIVGIKLTRT